MGTGSREPAARRNFSRAPSATTYVVSRPSLPRSFTEPSRVGNQDGRRGMLNEHSLSAPARGGLPPTRALFIPEGPVARRVASRRGVVTEYQTLLGYCNNHMRC